MRKKIILPVAAIGVLVISALLWTTVKTFAAGHNGAMAGNLAEKLNISEEQVSGALNQIQQENHQKRQEQISSKLDEAVKNSVITAEQKQKILDKQAEKRAAREKERTDMEQWYKDNGIDHTKLQNYLGKGRGMGGRGYGHNLN